MIAILQIADLLLNILQWIIIGQAILSWLVAFNVVNTHNDFVRQVLVLLDRMTQPLYRPIRCILPDFGAIDLSPFVVLLVIMILRNIVIPRIALSLY